MPLPLGGSPEWEAKVELLAPLLHYARFGDDADPDDHDRDTARAVLRVLQAETPGGPATDRTPEEKP